jgi:hypothetical protein
MRGTTDMKIRTGFVSNSSTSSFLVCGWKYPMPKDTESLRALFTKLCGETLDPGMSDNNITGAICDVLYEKNLGFCNEDDCFYIGNYIGVSDSSDDGEPLRDWQSWLTPTEKLGIDEEIENKEPRVYILDALG